MISTRLSELSSCPSTFPQSAPLSILHNFTANSQFHLLSEHPYSICQQIANSEDGLKAEKLGLELRRATEKLCPLNKSPDSSETLFSYEDNDGAYLTGL